MTWTLAQARARFADELRSNLVPNKLVQVYEAPPAQIVAPCAVIAPRSPYVQPYGYNIEEVQLAVTVFVPHSNAPDALDRLEEIAGLVAIQVEGGEGTFQPDGYQYRGFTSQFVSIDSIGTVTELGGITYLAATVNVTAYIGVLPR